MTDKKLEQGLELQRLISNTSQGLDDLYDIRLAAQKSLAEDSTYGNLKYDGLYSLNIGEHSDRSGINCGLSRYGGNVKLLEVIITELEIQLEEYQNEYKKL